MELRHTFLPPTVATLFAAVYLLSRVASGGWDPVEVFELGTRFSAGDAAGTEGYDGQFAYYIANDLDPESVRARLDVPAYRYQRILHPAASRLLAAGRVGVIPWTLLITGLIAHWLGTWSVANVLRLHGRTPWYSLSYGLWVGLIVSVGVGLPEPLAYGLVAGGLWARMERRPVLSGALLSASLFAKETTIVFWAAAVVAELLASREKHRGRRMLGALLLGGLAFTAWQVWLAFEFGSPGLASGGARATPFEWIPYGGFLRIATIDLPTFAGLAIIFGTTLVLPSLWGLVASVRRLTQGDRSIESLGLLGNAATMVVLPLSTYAEPWGLVRFADGLVLAVLTFAAAFGVRRALNYSLFWSALLVMLVAR